MLRRKQKKSYITDDDYDINKRTKQKQEQLKIEKKMDRKIN